MPACLLCSQAPGKDQVAACTPANTSQLAQRATDPAASPQPSWASAPEQSIYLGTPPELQVGGTVGLVWVYQELQRCSIPQFVQGQACLTA